MNYHGPWYGANNWYQPPVPACPQQSGTFVMFANGQAQYGGNYAQNESACNYQNPLTNLQLQPWFSYSNPTNDTSVNYYYDPTYFGQCEQQPSANWPAPTWYPGSNQWYQQPVPTYPPPGYYGDPNQCPGQLVPSYPGANNPPAWYQPSGSSYPPEVGSNQPSGWYEHPGSHYPSQPSGYHPSTNYPPPTETDLSRPDWCQYPGSSHPPNPATQPPGSIPPGTGNYPPPHHHHPGGYQPGTTHPPSGTRPPPPQSPGGEDDEIAIINGHGPPGKPPPIITDRPPIQIITGPGSGTGTTPAIIRPTPGRVPPGPTPERVPPGPTPSPPPPPRRPPSSAPDGSSNNCTSIVSAVGGVPPGVVEPKPSRTPPPIQVRLPDKVYDRCCGCYRQKDQAKCLRPVALALSILSLFTAPPFLSIPAVVFACRKMDLPPHASKYQIERRRSSYRTSIILAIIGIMLGLTAIITTVVVFRLKDPNMYIKSDIRYSVRGFDGTAVCWCSGYFSSQCNCQVERGSLYRNCHCDGSVCDCPTINVSG